jgi:tetratricopeptide (TPR) repeat protein
VNNDKPLKKNVLIMNPLKMNPRIYIRSILIMAGLISCIISQAQTFQKITTPVTYRILQTANTLMEAQRLDAAEEFFNRGLIRSKYSYDLFNQAYAYQGLGNLYIRLNQSQKAIDCYKKSIQLYKIKHRPMMTSLVENLLKSAQGSGDLYAGIEIGAKGVKLSVIEVTLSKDRQLGYKLITDSSVNTDPSSLSSKSEKETRDAIALFWKIIKERYHIPVKRIYAVMSSGLKQELDKCNKADYFARVIRCKDMNNNFKIGSVSAIQESELSMLGIVPQKDRYTTSQLDIGSGNTKGGYFNTSGIFVPVTFSLGTKSYQRLIDGRWQGDVNSFAKAAENLWKDSVALRVKWELEIKPDFKTRDIMYLSGGIVWALASYLHPNEFGKNYIEISSNDVSEFRRLVTGNYDELTNPSAIKSIAGSEQQEAVKKNLGNVSNTFDQRALTAGAIVLEGLIQEINKTNPGKKFIFPKYAYVGWISGYIIKKVAGQYTGMVKPIR